MRLAAAALLALILMPGGSPMAQQRTPLDSAELLCPILSTAIAAAVESTAVVRVMRQAGSPRGALDEMAGEQRAQFIDMLVSSLRVPSALMRRLLDSGPGPHGGGEIPDCSPVLPRASWQGDSIAWGSDTFAVSVSLPVFTRTSKQALVYVDWRDRSSWGKGTLSGGERASGSLYLLEQRAAGWKVVRSAGIWVRLLE